jgi:hypothetical protein
LKAGVADEFGVDCVGEEPGDIGKTECHTAPAGFKIVIALEHPAINGKRSAP